MSCIPSKAWDSATSLYWKNTSWLQPIFSVWNQSDIPPSLLRNFLSINCSYVYHFYLTVLNSSSLAHCWFLSMNLEYTWREGHLGEQIERMWGHSLNQEAHCWKNGQRENDTILENLSNNLQLCSMSLLPTRMLLWHSKVWSLHLSTSPFPTDEHKAAQQLPFQNSFPDPFFLLHLWICISKAVLSLLWDFFLRDDLVLRQELG